MKRVVLCMLAMMVSMSAKPQAVAGPEKAKPVAGDPGISSLVVIEAPQFRVLRDYAEPGATRRMHAHKDATYHVFVLITGQLRLTVEGDAPVDVNPGEALSLKGGVNHTFVNNGAVTATIVEVFGKGSATAADATTAVDVAKAIASITDIGDASIMERK